ncbi:PAX3- and PAX7-binding protein 1-like isoform X2 [Asterias amurensis]|uniref:PAX3- and PAX7-binding protein 1-like isoform X2 n=1 Tax=Asterias amurensis TaxID=7602 RepID=UPI003AB8146E
MMKKKRNIRRREETSDGEAEKSDQIPFLEEDYHTQVVKHVQKTLQKTADKKSKKKEKSGTDGDVDAVSTGTSLLSFDHDEVEEGEVFQVKKSSHSKKVAKKLRERARKERQHEEVAQHYKEMTDERTMDTKATGSNASNSGLHVKQVGNVEMILSGKDAEVAALEEEDRKELKEEVPVIVPGMIPDAAIIFAARKRRQKARELGTGVDYIPLDDTQRYNNTGNKAASRHDESRLIRDDDNDCSDSDGECRMSFTVKQSTSRQRMQQAIDEDADNDSDHDRDHDEEMLRWEQEQIKKGTSVPQAQDSGSSAAAATVAASYYYEQQEYPYGQPTSQYVTPMVGSYTSTMEQNSLVHALNAAPLCEMPTITMEQVKKKLKDWFESVKDVHRAHEREHDQLQERLKSCASSSVSLKDTQGGVNNQYHFFQEMKGYAQDLVDCFAEKVPVIDGLETAMIILLKSRAQKLSQRRQLDIRDQSEEFTGMLQRAALSANFDSGTKTQREDITKQRRAAEREARRSRRRRARELKQNEENGSHIEGTSSDDEQRESEHNQFNKERDVIMTESQKVFDDVIEDFSAISIILCHFEKWKHQQQESYEEAYISLCLPKLLAPLVRLQLLDWNPLQSDCHNLEEMPWYESMLFFGFQQTQSLDKEDLDINLIPSLVQKVVLPKLSALVEDVWDPMSTIQTNRLVSLIHKLVEDYPTVTGDSKSTRDLLKALVDRMRRTLDEDVYMPLFPKDMLDKSVAASNFMQRQFWSSAKLLGNLLLWHGLISEVHLLELAIDGLLNRYMLLSLQNSDVNDESIFKCQRIAAKFPPQWFKELQGDQTIRQLEPFCRYLKHAADTMKKRSALGNDMEKRTTRTGVKVVLKILVTIHAMDHALSISEGFSLKELAE